MDIFINNVSKSFGNKLVLKNFTATLYKNRFNCIMGPSGCGKTTLMNILKGFMVQDGGSIEGVPEKKTAVFQEDRLCESFSAVANVRMVCLKAVDNIQIKEHLKRIGIGPSSMDLPVSELSGGMRRRVAIVRAILIESDIVFLDEPFKGLDINTKDHVIQYVKDNIRNRTVVMVTHDIEEARALDANLISMEMIDND